MANTTIPTIIVTGFFGTGKSTLISQILSNIPPKKVAITSYDATLYEQFSNATIYHLSDKNQLGDITLNDCLKSIVAPNAPTIDLLIIETYGLENPGDIVFAIKQNDLLAQKIDINRVITVIDGQYFEENINDSNETATQIFLADDIVVNKKEQVSLDDFNEMIETISYLNPYALVLEGELDSKNCIDLISKNTQPDSAYERILSVIEGYQQQNSSGCGCGDDCGCGDNCDCEDDCDSEDNAKGGCGCGDSHSHEHEHKHATQEKDVCACGNENCDCDGDCGDDCACGGSCKTEQHAHDEHHHDCGCNHNENEEIQTHHFEIKGLILKDRFIPWFEMFIANKQENYVLRSKGELYFQNDNATYQLNSVRESYTLTKENSDNNKPKISKISFTGAININELKQKLVSMIYNEQAMLN